MESAIVIVGNIVHCSQPFAVHTLEKGFIITRNSKVCMYVLM